MKVPVQDYERNVLSADYSLQLVQCLQEVFGVGDSLVQDVIEEAMIADQRPLNNIVYYTKKHQIITLNSLITRNTLVSFHASFFIFSLSNIQFKSSGQCLMHCLSTQ